MIFIPVSNTIFAPPCDSIVLISTDRVEVMEPLFVFGVIDAQLKFACMLGTDAVAPNLTRVVKLHYLIAPVDHRSSQLFTNLLD
jgi:hypothetical protein